MRAVKTADVPRVRATVVQQLRRLSVSEPEAALVGLLLTELLSNGIRHSTSPVTCSLVWGDDTTRVEVCDDNPRPPVVVESPPDADDGRGMKLVASLSSRWGWQRSDEGKCVWFEVKPQAERVPA